MNKTFEEMEKQFPGLTWEAYHTLKRFTTIAEAINKMAGVYQVVMAAVAARESARGND